MAAYAALVSLMNTMEQVLNQPRLSISLDKKQIESVREKVDSMLDFIESYHPHGGVSKEAEDLESQIASAAHAAEDVIESHVVDQVLAGSSGNGGTSSSFVRDLKSVIEDMNYVQERVMEFKETKGFKDQQQPTDSTSATSSRPLTTGKNAMVGFDDELIQLMDRLTAEQPDRRIIPIVGMGGIGKTTLARNAYENSLIVQHFDIRCWATVSQEYSVRKILSELLSCLRNQEKDDNLKKGQENDFQLGLVLHKILFGQRFLIILDDMWSVEAWESINSFFPDDGHGSRIVVATRLSNVASYFRSSVFEMNFLDEDKSWKLFCEKAFPEEDCPIELEEIGKMIVKKCKGLPLSIVVIGRLLAKSNRTRDYWENVARDINSILKSDDDEHCLDILSLSYSHLPAHLKPCFLYMGIFPEDDEIRVSRLIKHWVAEGFLKPNQSQCLEEIAEDYLKDLVDRNLILVRRWRWNGNIKYYKIHDLLRELCLRIAEKEKFLYMMREHDNNPLGIDRERRIVFQESIPVEYHQARVSHTFSSASLARSFIFRGGPLPFKFRLLRVLSKADSDSLEAIFQQVNLRYLLYKPSWLMNPEIPLNLPLKLPSSISLLWNVQTLIIRGDTARIIAPPEIWCMRQLRHLDFNEVYLPPPQRDTADKQDDDFVLENLQTLSNVVNFRLSDEVCKRIPNVRKLHIRYDNFSGECETNNYHLNNLGLLHELRSLNCSFYGAPNRGDLLHSLTSLSSVQKLSLKNCFLRWKDVTTVGSRLPELKVLKLGVGSVIGPKWSPDEGAFPHLKFLRICCDGLIYWTADSTHFPVLEKLVLDNLHRLDEIPSGIGEIPTLRYLRLYTCSEAAAISSTKILEEQLNQLENEDLEVRVTFRSTMEEERFRKKVDIQGFTSKNFQHGVAFDFLSAMLAASMAFEDFMHNSDRIDQM